MSPRGIQLKLYSLALLSGLLVMSYIQVSIFTRLRRKTGSITNFLSVFKIKLESGTGSVTAYHETNVNKYVSYRIDLLLFSLRLADRRIVGPRVLKLSGIDLNDKCPMYVLKLHRVSWKRLSALKTGRRVLDKAWFCHFSTCNRDVNGTPHIYVYFNCVIILTKCETNASAYNSYVYEHDRIHDHTLFYPLGL